MRAQAVPITSGGTFKVNQSGFLTPAILLNPHGGFRPFFKSVRTWCSTQMEKSMSRKTVTMTLPGGEKIKLTDVRHEGTSLFGKMPDGVEVELIDGTEVTREEVDLAVTGRVAGTA